MLLKRIVIASSLFWLGLPAVATDLLDVWQAAQQRDPGLQAGRLSQAAGEKRRDQAQALWKTNVFVHGGVGLMGVETQTKGAEFSSDELPGLGGRRFEDSNFNTSIRIGLMNRLAISAVQPLFDPALQARAQQLQRTADLSDVRQQMVQQQLIQTVIERYFDLLVAQEFLVLHDRHEQSVRKALDELRRRQRVGDASQMDVQESAERLAALQAQRIRLDTDRQTKLFALQDLSGPAVSLRRLQAQIEPARLATSDLEPYVEQMRAVHPQLKAQDLQYEIALQEARQYGSGLKSARVDAIAQVSRDDLRGSGRYGAASNITTQHMVGVQLTIALTTGGFRSAKQEEAVLLAEQARTERAVLALRLEQGLRAAWLGLRQYPESLKARASVYQTNLKRLEATRQAHAQGSRTTLELLGAEQDAVAADRALFMERIEALMNRARLAALSGSLDEQTLRELNRFLQ